MPVIRLQQGEDLVSACATEGIPWRKVWTHPENQALRAKRSSPHLLMPGDDLFIPDLEQKYESCGTEVLHQFRASNKNVRFRVRIFERKADPKEKQEVSATSQSEYIEEQPKPLPETPVADTPFELFVDDASAETGVTDGDGYIDVRLPAAARSGLLVIHPGDDDLEQRISLNWRQLNPIEEISGVCQRLTNLGFPCPDDATELTAQIEAAITAFQIQHELEATGEIDDALRTKLVEKHGS